MSKPTDRRTEMRRVWAARSQAKVVEVAPNGNAQVTMEPSKVE